MLSSKVLEIPSNAVQEIRKMYNLDGPGKIDDAVNILETWIKQENHILKKDFSKRYFECVLIASKGSVEKAKKQIDKLCTLKTLLPQFFAKHNLKLELSDVLDKVYLIALPKMTSDFCRIYLCKFNTKEIEDDLFLKFYQYNIINCEFIKAHDYANGFIIVYDCQETNLIDIATKMNPIMLQQYMTILIEGFGARLKALHFLTQSKAIELLVKLLRQFLSKKISDRIFVHKTVNDLHAVIPKELLPEDYGGKQNSVEKLAMDWIEEVSSEEHVKYMKIMSEARTDERLRRSDKFNDEYMGMAGSFLNLNVD